MQKYQQLFLQKLNTALMEWNKRDHITQQELYRFLHTMKGTSASIGLDAYSAFATAKLESLSDADDRLWAKREWTVFIEEIIALIQSEAAAAISPTDDLPPASIQLVGGSVDHNGDDRGDGAIKHARAPLLLLINDNIQSLDQLKSELEHAGLSVIVAVNIEKAVEFFYDQQPDGVLLELSLWVSRRTETISTIMDLAKKRLIPVIMLTSDGSKETRLNAYEMGAADVLTQPVDIDELLIRVKNRLSHKEIAEHAILIDELTGAFNRKFLAIELECLLQEWRRSDLAFSLGLLDIDHFKKINDQYGHDTGDRVLRAFAQFLLKEKRGADFLIRYGGEEFIVLFPGTDKATAKIILERMLSKFTGVQFEHALGSFHVTFSAGVDEPILEEDTADALVKRADLALYQAKKLGRNRIEGFQMAMQQEVSLVKALNIAVVDDDQVIHHMLDDRLSKLQLPQVETVIQGFREGESFLQSDFFMQLGKCIVVLDGMMPRMDGLEVLYHIRQQRSSKDCVVIMLTGRKSDKDIARALDLGADDYMTKPFSLVELEARIKRWAIRML